MSTTFFRTPSNSSKRRKSPLNLASELPCKKKKNYSWDSQSLWLSSAKVLYFLILPSRPILDVLSTYSLLSLEKKCQRPKTLQQNKLLPGLLAVSLPVFVVFYWSIISVKKVVQKLFCFRGLRVDCRQSFTMVVAVTFRHDDYQLIVRALFL